MPENANTEVIRPFTEPKYEGPPATPDNFTQAFPDMERAVLSKVAPQLARNPLDPLSEKNLADLRRQVRANPFPAATVINLHPFTLQSSDMYLRGIVIPACEPGMDFAHHHIRSWNADKRYSEDGNSFIFTAIKPIEKAAQFLLKFANPEVYGGGVLIYEGDRHPNKLTDVELYSLDGRPMVRVEDGYDYDDEGHRLPSKIEIPLKGKLHELIEQERRKRNQFYLAKVTEADRWFKSGDSKKRELITDLHRLMQDVLVKEGVLDKPLDWNLASTLDRSKGEGKECKSCGSVIQGDPYRCTNAGCGNILKALEAFMDGAIEWGHVKIEMLPSEQYAVAEAEHKRRQEVKKSRKQEAKQDTK
jgi:hypothetical protein